MNWKHKSISSKFVSKFLGSYKVENFEYVIANLLHCYEVLYCVMSLKSKFIEIAFEFFYENLGAVSD